MISLLVGVIWLLGVTWLVDRCGSVVGRCGLSVGLYGSVVDIAVDLMHGLSHVGARHAHVRLIYEIWAFILT